MAEWSFVLAERDGTPIGALEARSRKLTWKLNDDAEADVTISGDDPISSEVVELATDVLAYRDEDLLFRGRIVSAEDTVDEDRHDVKLTAMSYLWLLGRRTVWPTSTLTYAAVDQASIAADLIADTQALTAGDLGIDTTVTATGTVRDRTYEVGKNIREALLELAAVQGGFDLDIDPALDLRIYFPTRGSLREDFAVVYLRPLDDEDQPSDAGGGNVARLGRTVSADGYANARRMSGADGVTPSALEVAGLAGRIEGRWEEQEGRTDLETATAVANANAGQLERSSTLLPSYSVVLRSSTDDDLGAGWTPDALWIGDQCRLRLLSGYRLDVDTSALRVSELALDISDDGVEVPALTFGAPPPKDYLRLLLSSMAAKLDNLSRR